MKKNILFFLLVALTLGFTSCSSDDPSNETIFPTTSPTRDSFESWLLKNYTYPYNIQFLYKLEDIETDMKYHLVPADSAKAAKLAIIVKYMWLESYDEVAGQTFTKTNVPRIINLVGSPAYNSEGTMVLGTAEGGLKVTLYMVNWLTDDMLHSYSDLNTYYFHTMHHEFTHILNQKKPYDTSFNLITESGYVSGDWYLIADSTAHKQGFVTPYAMNEPLEDFAEMNSVYITSSQDQWNAILADAGTNGAKLINAKLDILRNYFKNSWNIDIDEMRSTIMRRASSMKNLDLEHLN
jgi:substrate import-associated zinc metallohydrolase lipoprotein